jgi:hypothetical protein
LILKCLHNFLLFYENTWEPPPGGVRYLPLVDAWLPVPFTPKLTAEGGSVNQKAKERQRLSGAVNRFLM